VIRFAWTSRADGDLAGDLAGDLTGRPLTEVAAAPRPWTWLQQVHGADVVVVDRPGALAGIEADAAVTITAGCALAVRTADCAPLVLVGSRSVGVVHAGWRGLAAGIVAGAVDALRALDDDVVSAHLGPCIRPGCYEFDGPERAELEGRFGATVLATTTWGTPALDVPAAVRAALVEVGITELEDGAGCTACDRRWYSHRARGEAERFATVAWVEAP
jgi:YfiH family protein